MVSTIENLLKNDSDKKKKILIIDDEELNLDILREYLEEENFDVVSAANGIEGLEKLSENPDVDAIILDRMMPAMDGMTFLREVKAKQEFSTIPVIMQTAASSPEQIKEGIEAGVFYYLAKPYTKKLIISILNSALEHDNKFKKFADELETHKKALGLLNKGSFKFQNLEDARNLSMLVAGFMPDPEKALFGLHELTVNAVEHGNLGVTYDEKKKLLENSVWRSEIDKRCALPENLNKWASLEVGVGDNYIEVVIEDAGAGFDYKKYLEIDTSRATDPNGKGIAITKMYSFDEMEYLGNGNKVRCRVNKIYAKN